MTTKKKATKKTPSAGALSITQTVTRPVIAQLLDVSQGRIDQLVMEGMPKAARGKYEPLACVNWFIEFWRERATGTDASLDDIRKKLIVSQTEKNELDNAARKGELLPANDVTMAVQQIAVICSTRMDGLGARLAVDLASESDPARIETLVRKETRDIRRSIAQEIERLAAGIDEEPGGE